MRIAMLAPYESTQGAVPRIAATMRDVMKAHGHDVVMYSWGRRTDHESAAQKLFRRPIDAVRLGLQLRRDDFDVVLVHTGLDRRTVPRDILLLLAAGKRCLGVIEIHGSRADMVKGHRGWIGRRGVSALLNMCSGAFVLSSEEAELLGSHTRTALTVVKNPFDSGFAILPRERAGLTALFVGRLVAEKGVFDLISAWAGVTSHVTGARLIFAGAGPAQAECERLAETFGVSDSVTFAGHVAGVPLHQLYATCDVLVLPSYDEGFPTVVAEAMSYGMAVVTTSIRGSRDWLVEGRNCLFVEPGSVGELGKRIIRLLSDPELADRIGANNVQDVRMFSPEAVVTSIEAELVAIIARNKGVRL